MSTITWPGFKTGPASFGVEFDVQMEIMRNGRVTSYGLPGARWVCTLNFEDEMEDMQRPAIEAWLMSLAGGANRASLYHFGRPIPNGTMRGSPTLSAGAAAGAQSVSISTTGTLKAGDLFGLGGQILAVLQDATPVSGVLTVSFAQALRTAQSSGAAVTWNKPTAQFIPKSNIAGPFPYLQNLLRPGFATEFVEAW